MRSFQEARAILAEQLLKHTGSTVPHDVDAVLCEDNQTVMLEANWYSDQPIAVCFDLAEPIDPQTFDASDFVDAVQQQPMSQH